MPKPDCCVTCGLPIREGQDHPHYFGQYSLRNSTAADFTEEVRNLSDSLAALCAAILELSDKDPLDDDTRKILSGLYGLIWDLGREIEQRAELAHHVWQDNDETGTPTEEKREVSHGN